MVSVGFDKSFIYPKYTYYSSKIGQIVTVFRLSPAFKEQFISKDFLFS